MVTYDEVKQKAVDLRNSILKAMHVNKPARAKAIYSQVRAKLDSIISNVLNAITAVSHSQLDSYLAELSYSQPATEFGMKTINIAYSGDTTEINGETVIPYDQFSFDLAGYLEKLKQYPKEVSRRMLPIRVDNSYSPPSGDWEDAIYTYYLPYHISLSYEFTYDLLNDFGGYGILPKLFEFELYEAEWEDYLVRLVKGIFDHLLYQIGDTQLSVDIASNNIVVLEQGANSNIFKSVNYRYIIIINNFYENPIEFCYNNQTFACAGNHITVWLCLADIHLYPAPLKILESTL